MAEIGYKGRTAAERALHDAPLAKMGAAAVLLKAGHIDQENFLAICLDLLAAARTTVAVGADVFVAALRSADPIGYTPTRDYSARDTASLLTVMQHSEPTSHIQRFTMSTLEQYFRDAVTAIASELGALEWEWHTGGSATGACPECHMKDGKRFPIDVPQIDHPGCKCLPVPIF